MKALNILAALLIASVLANIALFAIVIPSQQGIISHLVEKTNTLGMENMLLQKQLDQQNLTLQSFASQLSFYRATPRESGTVNQASAEFISGFASIH